MTIRSRRFPIALLTAWASAFAALAAPAVASADAGQIIVRFAPGADARDRSDARATADVVRDESLGLARTELVTPERGTTVSEAVADLERSPGVAYAEPDLPRRAFAAANDDRFDEQWALHNTGQDIFYGGSIWRTGTLGADINVTAAWDVVTETSAKVAVVDSGVALAHPDLVANIAPGGRDFVDDDAVPADENGHGTHVTGTIGASGDNTAGVTGVAWRAQLLPIRVLDADGNGSLSDVVAGYTYADGQGAKVVNVSLGGNSPSQAEYDAIRNASDVLFVTAAGNDGEDVDTVGRYPCAYELPNVVCVAATGGDDELAGFSNHGAHGVDLAAPGVDILSTYPQAGNPTADNYQWLRGTSMATPHVAGAAALILGQSPGLAPSQVRGMLLSSVAKVDALAGKVASGGRLDVAAALHASAPEPVAQPQLQPAQPIAPAPPSTPPAPAPVPAVDRTAPVLTLAAPARAALRSVLARGLRVPTTCSERCSLRVALTLDRRTAKRLRLARGSATVRVASGAAALSGAGSRAVTVRFASTARRALARVRRVTVTLRVTATDPAGNRRVRRASVTLAR